MVAAARRMQKVGPPVTDNWAKRLYGLTMKLLSHGIWMSVSIDRSKQRSGLLGELTTDRTIVTSMVVVNYAIGVHEQGCPPDKEIYMHI
jgi:hypothetical protein